MARICQRLDGTPPGHRAGGVARLRAVGGRDPCRTRRAVPAPAQRRRHGARPPAHHDALLDWSYDLLTATERAAFERLSFFAGTFGLDAATAAVGHARHRRLRRARAGVVARRQVPRDGRAGGQRHPLPDAGNGAGLRRRPPRTPPAGRPPRTPASPSGTSSGSRWRSGATGGGSARLAPELDTLGALIDGLDPASEAVPALARLRVEPRAVAASPASASRRSTTVLAGSPRLGRRGPAAARVGQPAGRRRAGGRGVAALRPGRGDARRRRRRRPVGLGAGGIAPGHVAAARPHRRGARCGPDAGAAAGGSGDDRRRPRRRPPAPRPRGHARGDGDVAEINAEVSALARRSGDHVLVALALNNLVEEELRDGAVPRPPATSATRSTTPPSSAWSTSPPSG